MKVTKQVGICINCNKPTPFILLQNEKLSLNLTLNSYEQFKSIKINKCDNCDYVNQNLTCNQDYKIFEIVKSQKYKDLLKNNYDKEVEDYFPSSQSLTLNYFDAYAYLCHELNDYKNECICLYNCVKLKDILIGKYSELMYTSPNNNELYEQIVDKLNQSKNEDLKNIENYASKTDDVYIKLLLAESLIMQNKIKQAKLILKNMDLDQSLKVYFKKLIMNTEVEIWLKKVLITIC